MLGVVAFAYQGITYTTREKVIDIGPLQATVDTKHAGGEVWHNLA